MYCAFTSWRAVFQSRGPCSLAQTPSQVPALFLPCQPLVQKLSLTMEVLCSGYMVDLGLGRVDIRGCDL